MGATKSKRADSESLELSITGQGSSGRNPGEQGKMSLHLKGPNAEQGTKQRVHKDEVREFFSRVWDCPYIVPAASVANDTILSFPV